MASWFEKLTGFEEADYASTKQRLRIEDGQLVSDASTRKAAVGQLELISLTELRERIRDVSPSGRLRLSIVQGDARSMHSDPRNAGALFQVASQFNLLEMTSPQVTPEAGVTCYEWDHTQGPACAIAAGAGTIYRNYFARVGDQEGQTADQQFDGLADLGNVLAATLGVQSSELWSMQNGYAFPTEQSLARIGSYLQALHERERDDLRGRLRVGLHSDVEVTDGASIPGPLVSQIYCSALPVAYSRLPSKLWTDLGRLILEAAYEATLMAGILNAARGKSNRILLTRLGGGAFGNDDLWISVAILRALRMMKGHDLDIQMVSYGQPTREMLKLLDKWDKEPHQIGQQPLATKSISKVMPVRLDESLARFRGAKLEAANRAEVTALLIRCGYRVYRPEADIEGEDLVVRTPSGTLHAVQLKGRPSVDWRRYAQRDLWMLFPSTQYQPSVERSWFLVPHDDLYAWVEKRHGHAPQWARKWSYPFSGKELVEFLSKRNWKLVPPAEAGEAT